MNIMMNNICNLRCSYCFAQNEMTEHTPEHISEENFRTFLDFLKENKFPTVRMIGGEPTLHPRIIDFINIVIDYGCFEDILIFTNFTFNDELAKQFIEVASKITINFLPNINDNPLILPRIKRNYDILTAGIPYFDRIGVNIFKPDQDMSLWEDLITKYSLKKVRWSVVVPNKAMEPDFDMRKYFHSFQNILVKLASWQMDYGVDLSCDCNGIPICAIDPEVLAYIIKINPQFFGPMYCVGGAVDVTPDLYVRGCFAQSIYRKPLSTFKTIQEFEVDIEKDRTEARKIAPTKECLACPRHITTGEFCSCLSYRRIENNENKTTSCA